MDVITEIKTFRENMYIGKLLDNSLMNSILENIGKKLSENDLNQEDKLKINNYLNMCINALSNKDYVYLADLLYFEIMPLIKKG